MAVLFQGCFETDVDYESLPQHNIQTIPNVASAQDCMDTCDLNAMCNHIVYDTTTEICTTKNDYTQKITGATGIISGSKTC